MAENTSKTAFPVIPVKHWWALRERFKKTIPAVVNESYLASVLDMTEISARSNIIPSLRYTGIIDDEGKPTERAVKWRDDIHYAEVCEEIRKEVYPSELLDIAPDPEHDRESAQRWLANTTRAGEKAVNRILAVYLLLVEADVSKSTGAIKPGQQKSKAIRKMEPSTKELPIPAVMKPPVAKVDTDIPQSGQASQHRVRTNLSSALNLNIQIHISSEASPEQIDQIFASMAKHLKDLLD